MLGNSIRTWFPLPDTYAIWKVEDFTYRLNYGDSSIIFSDELGLTNWLKDNISSTGFTNLADAYARFDNLKSSSLSIIAANNNFFTEMTLPDASDDLAEIIREPITPPTLASPSHNDCINEAVYTDRENRTLYAAAIAASAV
jgi:hypothetical protein